MTTTSRWVGAAATLVAALFAAPNAAAGDSLFPEPSVRTDFFLDSVDIDWSATGTPTKVCYGGSGDSPFGPEGGDLDRRDCVLAGARGALVASLTRSATATGTLSGSFFPRTFTQTVTSSDSTTTVVSTVTSTGTLTSGTRTLSGTETATVTNGAGAIGPLMFTEAGEWPEAVYVLFLQQMLNEYEIGGPVLVNCVALFEESFGTPGLQVTSIVGYADDLVYTNCPQLWQLYDDFCALFGCPY